LVVLRAGKRPLIRLALVDGEHTHCRLKETSNEEITTTCHVRRFKCNKAFLTHTRLSSIKLYISCSYGFFLNYAISGQRFYFKHIQPQITPSTAL